MAARNRRDVSLAVLVCLSLLGAHSSFATPGSLTVPVPSGTRKVGTLWIRLVDKSRTEPYLRDNAKRELLVRFWYPMSGAEPCMPAPYASPKVWRYLSQLTGVQLPEVRTNSCLNARVADGFHPVVVATHGYTATLTDYTFLFEDLASRGYVVASVAHTYETTAVEFPDGRLVRSVLGSYLAPSTLRSDFASLAFARSVRLTDLKFFLTELRQLNAASDSPFAGKLDLARVGLMGHSLGGEAALSTIEGQTGFKAAVLLDGEVSDASVIGSAKPVFILAAGREQWNENECKLWNNLRGPRLAVNLRGANHFTPSDATWLLKDMPLFAVPAGAMSPEKTISVMRNYVAAFFDANLRGNPQNPLLSGALHGYGGAVVTTQKELLCPNQSSISSGGLR